MESQSSSRASSLGSWFHGPLGECVGRMSGQAPPRRKAGEDVPVLATDPGEQLAGLLDLHGSVHLAEKLDLLGMDQNPPKLEDLEPDDLRARLQDKLSRLDRRLEKTFEEAMKPRFALPRPDGLLNIVSVYGVIDERSGAPLKKATKVAWLPFAQYMDAAISQSRRELSALREAMGPAMRSMGPEAVELQALDELVNESTRLAVAKRIDLLHEAVGRAFAEVFRDFVLGLPDEPALDDIAAAYADGGWIPHVIQLIRENVFGIHDHYRNLFEALVEASCTLAEKEKNERL